MAGQEDAGSVVADSAKMVSREQLEKEIMTLLNRKPILWYSDDVEKSSPLHNAKRTEDDVARAWLKGVISKSDLFIIEAVYRLSFATVEMITDMLKFMKMQNPNMLIPVVGIQAVKNRVVELSNNGLLGGCKYTVTKNGEKKAVIVYTCLHNGFRLLKKQFGYSMYQDDMLLALNDVEIFSRVAASYCALAVASLKKQECMNIYGYGEDKSFGKDFRPQLYAQTVLQGEDGIKVRIAFEALYHHYDSDINNAEDIHGRQIKRLDMLLKWALKCENVLREHPRIVIICEDKEGLIRAFKMIHENIPDLEPYICYTTEMVTRSLARKKDALDMMGFLRMSSGEKGICLQLDSL